MLLELQQLRAVPAALGSLFHAHHSLKNLFLTLNLTQLHAVPSGTVAVTESRAQCCPSAPCEELQPP